MFERRVQKEDIIFCLKLQSHSFSNKVKFKIFLLLIVQIAGKFFYPLLDENLQSFCENGLQLSIKLRNPSVQIGNFFPTEIIDNLLNHFKFLVQNIFFQGTRT